MKPCPTQCGDAVKVYPVVTVQTRAQGRKAAEQPNVGILQLEHGVELEDDINEVPVTAMEGSRAIICVRLSSYSPNPQSHISAFHDLQSSPNSVIREAVAIESDPLYVADGIYVQRRS